MACAACSASAIAASLSSLADVQVFSTREQVPGKPCFEST